MKMSFAQGGKENGKHILKICKEHVKEHAILSVIHEKQETPRKKDTNTFSNSMFGQAKETLTCGFPWKRFLLFVLLMFLGCW